MSLTNCVNCGAGKDSEEIKCPFCGTLYFDLTALDLDGHTPVACVFKMPGHYSNIEKATMLARPFLESIEEDQPDTCELWADNSVVAVMRSPVLPKFNLQFNPIPQHDGRFITVYTK